MIFNQYKNEYEKPWKLVDTKPDWHIPLLVSKIKRRIGLGIIFLNPPYNLASKTKIGKVFFKLLEKSFPLSNILNTIFTRNYVKISYSCMPNVDRLINKINRKNIIIKSGINPDKCNCRNKTTWPLKSKCQQEWVVYKGTISRNNSTTNKKNSKCT